MSKEIFPIKFEIGNEADEIYEVCLEHITGDIYSDGVKYFQLTESFVYIIEKTTANKKSKKKRVAKRKGKDLVLSNKKDKIVFSPEVVVRNSLSKF